jgi:hypothetical protein
MMFVDLFLIHQKKMIAIKLAGQNITCDYICSLIQREIVKHSNEHKELILTISIKEISYDDVSHIPKLEYKNLDCPS